MQAGKWKSKLALAVAMVHGVLALGALLKLFEGFSGRLLLDVVVFGSAAFIANDYYLSCRVKAIPPRSEPDSSSGWDSDP